MKKNTVSATIIRLIIYLFIIALPLILAKILIPGTNHNFYIELGKSAALLAIGFIILQPVLSARLKAISRPIGLDMIYRFHKSIPVIALILLILHPVLLSAGSGSWVLITSLQLPWYIILGKLALLLLFINIIVSYWRKDLSMGFQSWRVIHNIVGLIIIFSIFIHSWQVGSDIQKAGMQVLWIILLLGGVGFYMYHKIIRPIKLKRKPFVVTQVSEVNEEVTTLRFEPTSGQTVFDHFPGQFHFIRLYRNRGLPKEEHHFTISSGPQKKGFLESTIKASGDYTETIKKTKIGDKAAIHGPFGRFSYALHQNKKNLVFIAGGIGITPIMCMIRDIANKQDADFDIILLYANQTEKDILFYEELNRLEKNKKLNLNIVYFLAVPPGGWNGETGFITQEKIEKYCTVPGGQAFYICGPPPMMRKTISHLRAMKVRNSHIFYEKFSL